MKYLLLALFILFSFTLQAQITGLENLAYQFEITDVGSQSVEGILTLTNYHDQDWSMQFPYATFADIRVDGAYSSMFYLPVFSILNISAHQSYQYPVSHYSETIYSTGYHTAQAYMLFGNNPPVGNSTQFWAGTHLEEISDLTWSLALSEVNVNTVSCLLTISNPNPYLWTRDFTFHPLFMLNVDDSPGIFMYMEYPDVFSLDPGETVTHTVVHGISTPEDTIGYAVGTHTVQAYACFQPGSMVGNQLQFTVLPSSVSDEQLAIPRCEIYPNPLKDYAKLIIHSPKNATARISVYNLKGQKVNTMADLRLVPGENSFDWQATDSKGNRLSSGLYMLRIEYDGTSKLIRAMVLR
ncbi:MAG: T9SS type A sorting domain-containing protein [Candidatus Cloacimonetes bacterium]|nr:T9SS type A sorting domain-containing protein [Candidatus Cloacimonadota bacterium]